MKKLITIFGHAAFFMNVFLIFLLLMEDRIGNLSPWMQAAGRLHPMVLHFPIALWIVALAFEWMGKKDAVHPAWNYRIEFLLSFTAVTAAAAAVFGLLLYTSGAYENGSQLQWHKWLGATVSFLALGLVWLRKSFTVVYKISLIAGVVVVMIAGHLGAGITHGNDFLTAPFKSKREPLADIQKAQLFRDIIQPILDEKCTGCHNPNKAKGGLQLISQAAIMKGGEDGAVIIPGHPDSSMFYNYLLLPLFDEKHMPPEGKPQPDQEEIALIHWWIVNGADFKNQVSAVKTPDSIRNIIQQKYGQASPLDGINIAFASPETIKELNTTGRNVRQISADKPYIDVFLGSRKEITPGEWQELNAIKNQIVSIDCSHSTIGKDAIGIIAGFPHLQKLHLQHTDVTSEQLSALKQLSYLEYINVSGSAVTVEALDQLRSFKNLRKVYLYESNIPADSIRNFATANKQLRVGYTPDLSSDSAFAGRLSEPIVKVDSLLFRNHATVEMSFRLKGVNIHFTTNGKMPDEQSPRYANNLKIDSSCELKVIAVRPGWKNSAVVTNSLLRSRYQPVRAVLAKQPDKRYAAKGDTTLIDMERGSTSQGDGKYLGFEGEDLDAQLDLGALTEVNSVAVGYLLNHGGYIVAPVKVEIWGSVFGGQRMKLLSTTQHRDTGFISGSSQRLSKHVLNKTPVRFLRVKVINGKKLPLWHPAKGSKSWLFVDEIVVN